MWSTPRRKLMSSGTNRLERDTYSRSKEHTNKPLITSCNVVMRHYKKKKRKYIISKCLSNTNAASLQRHKYSGTCTHFKICIMEPSGFKRKILPSLLALTKEHRHSWWERWGLATRRCSITRKFLLLICSAIWTMCQFQSYFLPPTPSPFS